MNLSTVYFGSKFIKHKFFKFIPRFDSSFTLHKKFSCGPLKHTIRILEVRNPPFDRIVAATVKLTNEVFNVFKIKCKFRMTSSTDLFSHRRFLKKTLIPSSLSSYSSSSIFGFTPPFIISPLLAPSLFLSLLVFSPPALFTSPLLSTMFL